MPIYDYTDYNDYKNAVSRAAVGFKVVVTSDYTVTTKPEKTTKMAKNSLIGEQREIMKSFNRPNDLPGKDSVTGKTAKHHRDIPAALNESDAKLINEARALLDDYLYNHSPLHDVKHPQHEQVKKVVRQLEEKITQLTLDIPPSEQTKSAKHTSTAKN